ncbi:MAG: U32 family peptidase [Clostridia bacterium]|nr:U32 family peptidase [Clostridia bacterium]
MAELLSPAGNFEKLKAALLYGADAVYLAGRRFGMRSAADNFTVEELYEASKYVHERGKKLYLTLNTMPHSEEYPALAEFLEAIRDAKIDAFIIADLGVLALVRKILGDVEIHISTQAGIVSAESALAYVALGAKRLVLARELTLSEISRIRAAIPCEVELEAFVHGSMCVSYSGRCMLSHHLTGRDANKGACTQPCRWNYYLVEEKRPDIPLPIEENDLGTFIMSSKDMCTISIIPELMRAGINSFKIEGRMKSAYYTAVVTNAYRMAMDAYERDRDGYELDESLLRELDSVSHREYCTGYYLDTPEQAPQLASATGYIREKAYFATALSSEELPLPECLEPINERGTLYPFIQRNKVKLGDTAEIISPNKIGRAFVVNEIYDDNGAVVESAPHPSMKFFVRVPFEVCEGDIMRSGDN